MIFYFSGQFPKTRKDYPNDLEMSFFKKNGMSFDHLISLMYGKEAEQILKNVELMEADNGEGKQIRTSELNESGSPRRRN